MALPEFPDQKSPQKQNYNSQYRYIYKKIKRSFQPHAIMNDFKKRRTTNETISMKTQISLFTKNDLDKSVTKMEIVNLKMSPTIYSISSEESTLGLNENVPFHIQGGESNNNSPDLIPNEHGDFKKRHKTHEINSNNTQTLFTSKNSDNSTTDIKMVNLETSPTIYLVSSGESSFESDEEVPLHIQGVESNNNSPYFTPNELEEIEKLSVKPQDLIENEDECKTNISMSLEEIVEVDLQDIVSSLLKKNGSQEVVDIQEKNQQMICTFENSDKSEIGNFEVIRHSYPQE